MTRNEIAQLIMLGIPADNDLSGVRDLQPGGVVLMGRNAATPAETRRFTRAINEACEENPLIATDQEGGRVQRFSDGFTTIPSARELGERGAGAVKLMAANVAAELRAAGLSVDFAPVCDVPVHPDDTVIGHRAFSDDPIRASILAAEWIRGMQPTLMCVAKHFPGHGGVGVDSHQGLPTFWGRMKEEDSWMKTPAQSTAGGENAPQSTADAMRELRATHLPPFQAAMAAGVGGVMIGHIAIPDLEPSGDPATLSANIVTKLLREELRFRGVVFTDDLEMGALKHLDSGDIAVRAIEAGCDMLLFCHSTDKAARAIEAIEIVLRDNAIFEERVRDAIGRVRWAKQKFGVLPS